MSRPTGPESELPPLTSIDLSLRGDPEATAPKLGGSSEMPPVLSVEAQIAYSMALDATHGDIREAVHLLMNDPTFRQ